MTSGMGKPCAQALSRATPANYLERKQLEECRWVTVAPLCRTHSARVGSPRRRGGKGLGGRRGGRQIKLEGEPRSPIRAGFHPQLRAHRADQLAADRQPEARAGEVVARPRRRLAERLVE